MIANTVGIIGSSLYQTEYQAEELAKGSRVPEAGPGDQAREDVRERSSASHPDDMHGLSRTADVAVRCGVSEGVVNH